MAVPVLSSPGPKFSRDLPEFVGLPILNAHLTIILRTCSKRNFHQTGRFVAAAKKEITLRSLNSLLEAARHARELLPPEALRIVIVDDHSDPEIQASIQALLTRSGIANDFILVEGSGNGASLRTTYEFARWNAPDLIYFVEDDYLHSRESLSEMLGSFHILKSKMRQDCVLLPYDCPDRYLDGHVYPSILLLGEGCHWRSVQHSTGTFLITRDVFMNHWEIFQRFTLLDRIPNCYEADTINKIYEKVPCFSPIPSLALHLGESGSEAPFVEWTSLWDQQGSHLKVL